MILVVGLLAGKLLQLWKIIMCTEMAMFNSYFDVTEGYIWGGPSMRVSKNGCFREIPIKFDDLGVPISGNFHMYIYIYV